MLLDNKSDEELMVLYQNGAEAAFIILYARHSSKIYGFLKSRVSQTEKVADIYQEVFIKLHKSKHLYNKSFLVLPWIFTITKSVMIDELRKDKKNKLNEDVDLSQIPALPEKLFLPEAATVILKNLPENQKAVLHMRYVEDKTFEEIAELLKTSPSNIRQIVSRGIKRLKEIIDQGEQS